MSRWILFGSVAGGLAAACAWFALRSTRPEYLPVSVGFSQVAAASSAIASGVVMPPSFAEDVARVEAEVDRIEAEALRQAKETPLDAAGTLRILGKLLLFDKQLSAQRNEACSFCHMPQTGFTGPIESLNLTTVAYPGSVRTRFSQRKPQSYMYAPFAPALHYNALRGDFVGGNFWDMRASGFRLLNCAAEQAQGPPTNPVEMGLPDSACVAYRISTGAYRSVFERAWGDKSLAIDWPRETEKTCSQPGPPPKSDPLPVHVKPSDRQTANVAFDQMALAIAAYEMTPEVSPFTSKYDQVQADKEQFSAQEKAGYALFRGRAGCNKCHRDGGPGEEPLFTDFTASNLGVPRNPALPFLHENEPDASGFVANPDGPAYVDRGVGGFLENTPSFFDRPNPDANWAALAPKFNGNFQVPTLRNVDMRPHPDFVKAYMHNGYFKSLKEVVHFYNTRDVLPRCQPVDPREKVSCWPAPEDPENVNKTELGHLGLTSSEEDAVVAFLRTLTDGYEIPSR